MPPLQRGGQQCRPCSVGRPTVPSLQRAAANSAVPAVGGRQCRPCSGGGAVPQLCRRKGSERLTGPSRPSRRNDSWHHGLNGIQLSLFELPLTTMTRTRVRRCGALLSECLSRKDTPITKRVSSCENQGSPFFLKNTSREVA